MGFGKLAYFLLTGSSPEKQLKEFVESLEQQPARIRIGIIYELVPGTNEEISHIEVSVERDVEGLGPQIRINVNIVSSMAFGKKRICLNAAKTQELINLLRSAESCLPTSVGLESNYQQPPATSGQSLGSFLEIEAGKKLAEIEVGIGLSRDNPPDDSRVVVKIDRPGMLENDEVNLNLVQVNELASLLLRACTQLEES